MLPMKTVSTIAILLLLPFVVNTAPTEQQQELVRNVAKDCCNMGRNSPSPNCDDFRAQPNYDPPWNQFCREHFIKCCQEVKAKENCELGKNAAFAGADCGLISPTFHQNHYNVYKDFCCNSCRTGISSANETKDPNRRVDCTLNLSTLRLDDIAYSECCKKQLKILKEKPDRRVSMVENEIPNDEQYKCPFCPHKCIPDASGVTHCQCFSGFELAPDKVNCLDINECSKNETLCRSNEKCINTEGSFKCVLLDQEFSESKQHTEVRKIETTTPMSEEDIFSEAVEFENHESTEVGEINADLVSCDAGFEYDNEKESCEDVDECAKGESLCLAGEICINTEGSYQCKEADCPADLKYEGGKCIPTEECEHGFVFEDSFLECRDIDECFADPTPCDQNQMCVNTIGSYKCEESKCGHGERAVTTFFGGISCEDIDECREGTFHCSPLEKCRNTQGSYECDCVEGYEKSGDTKECVDIDECKMNPSPCPTRSICINSPGSYECECLNGYQKESDGIERCIDIDECLEEKAICPKGANCLNTDGHYQCKCPPNYELDDRLHQCINPNPCKGLSMNGTCYCPSGFKLFDNECHDTNECESKTFCQEEEECLNLFGEAKCISTKCPDGYRKDPRTTKG